MKSLLFWLIIGLLSCKSRTTDNPISQHETVPDLSFQGISIFKKNTTITEIETILKGQKTPFYNVTSEDEALQVYGLPFICCINKEVLYIPNYNIGGLFLNDLFLIFQDTRLVVIRSEVVRNERLNNEEPLSELKSIFQKKYGKGVGRRTDSVSDDGMTIQIDKEVMTNRTDSIIMVFENYREIDTIRVFDRSVPKNDEAIRINSAKQSFNEKMTKTKPPKAVRPISDLRPDWPYSYYPMTTIYYSFEVTFPNHLRECCGQVEKDQKLSDSLKKEKRTKGILDRL